jgi:prepilin-type N-terminal cleavage/methylation domain-containing protein
MDRGFTLIELIFSVVILGILSAFTFSFIYSNVRTYNLMRTQGELWQEGGYALERITRDLRDASFRVSTWGGLSMMKSHPTVVDPNPFVRYYQWGGRLYRCSDASFGSVCQFNPFSSPTNQPICGNVDMFSAGQNVNSQPCDSLHSANCQDDSFYAVIRLRKDDNVVAMSATVTPKNYCANGPSPGSWSCGPRDPTGRSFNGDYQDAVN